MNPGGRPGIRGGVDIDTEDASSGNSGLAADRGIYFSDDGRRRQEELLNVAHKKRRVQPSELADSFALWIPVEGEGFDSEVITEPAEPENDAVGVLGKRKQYAGTRDPMSKWRPLKSFFLDELNRHESLGDDLADPRCGHCAAQFNVGNNRAAHSESNNCSRLV
ncbi:hypothetical protein B0H11DRAFT_2235964 [Mycena galericulata]|nr:hypothetical protein B0H11DRAFT_2235964 [Mycena galericulata]